MQVGALVQAKGSDGVTGVRPGKKLHARFVIRKIGKADDQVSADAQRVFDYIIGIPLTLAVHCLE